MGPSCTTSVYLPKFTEFESRVVVSIDVELIDLESPAEYVTSLVIDGLEIFDFVQPTGHKCGSFVEMVFAWCILTLPCRVFGKPVGTFGLMGFYAF